MTQQNQPPQQAVATLPILNTLIDAFVIAYGNPPLLFRAALGGLLLLAATTMVALIVPANAFTLLLMLLAPCAAYTHFGVNWYRIVLLGPQGMVRPALRWDRRHWRFLALGLLIGAALLMLGAVITMIVPLSAALVALGLLYLAARLSFMFPAAAVEESYTLAFAWRHTQGQGGMRLTLLLLIAGLPLFLAVAYLASMLFAAVIGISLFDLAALQRGDGGLAEGGTPPEISPMAALSLKMVTEALTMAVMAVLYTIVALAFRTCTGWVPAGGDLPVRRGNNGPEDGGDRQG
ncbi:hypothetical protein [Pelagibius sp. 7325]|uniref:hypothetical protein n=1 Tax=Pelagibius sp. 7325 TaxID=3131994 RepID=UPI0030EC417C